MITTVGIDLVEVEVIKKILQSIKTRTFSSAELDFGKTKLNQYQHFAGKFAAKEAMMKALGEGWTKNLQWKDIEVLNNPNGKPYITLHRNALKLFTEKGFSCSEVSISHTENYAVSIVMLY